MPINSEEEEEERREKQEEKGGLEEQTEITDAENVFFPALGTHI